MPLPIFFSEISPAVDSPVVIETVEAIEGQQLSTNASALQGFDDQPSELFVGQPVSDTLAGQSVPPEAPTLPLNSPVPNTDLPLETPDSDAPANSIAWQDRAFPTLLLPAIADSSSAPETPAPDGTTDNSAGSNPLALRLQADAQSYDQVNQIIRAEGDVLVEFADGQLASDRLWANLVNRFVRAEGDVLYTRGDQLIAGERATYNLAQGSGSVFEASGTLNLESTDEDFSSPLPTDVAARAYDPIDRQILPRSTPTDVTNTGGLTLATEGNEDLAGGEGGDIRRLRFEADRIDFDADSWQAEDIRLTNDPFSPPELELRGNNARLTPLNEEEDELIVENARLVFDQGFSLPLFQSRFILRRGALDTDSLNPLPTAIGIDGRDRDGLYLERAFNLSTGGPWRLSIVPQFYVSRWLSNGVGDLADPSVYGVVGRLRGPLGPRTSLNANLSLPGLDLENFQDRLRANVRAQHLLGDHTLNFEYSYRDRLFNGSLGFQDVQTSLGLVLLSPVYRLGDSQIDLSYQVSAQYVSAATDRPELIIPGNPDSLANLFRFQGSVALSRRFAIWQGEALPATPTEGLRYTPRPVVPYFHVITGLRGITTYYTSDDLQETLTASVGIEGVLGHFSRDTFDYTRFNLTYSKSFVGGATSPFLFDRDVDRNTLSGGLIQQIYGPLRAGFQTSVNLDNGNEIDTDLILEYSRRTYGLVFRYNPVQTSGYVGLRLSDFDWSGRGTAFDSTRRVEGGVIR